MTSTSTRDVKMYPICDPWLGQAGAPFERVFAPAFKAGLLGRNDEFSSYDEHMRGTDPGGIPKPTAAQLAANANHVNVVIAHQGNAADIRKSQQAFKNRSSEIIAQLRRHVPVVRLQQKIDAMVEASVTNAPGQPVLQVAAPAAAGGVPGYHATHPLAGAARQSCQPRARWSRRRRWRWRRRCGVASEW